MTSKITLFMLVVLPFALCSDGDRSPFFQKCLTNCKKANCTVDGKFQRHAAKLQDKWCRLLFWSCKEECIYSCMWKTVSGFQERNYEYPKFYGKWPFVRYFGVQEPASALASVLNLLMHIYMYHYAFFDLPFRRKPVLVGFWHIFAIVCINAWVWSTIFHMRDRYFTEFMDYACALSVTIMLFLSAIVRLMYKRTIFLSVLVTIVLLFYGNYLIYLYEGKIDYGYNMRINVYFGLAAFTIWMLWTLYQLSLKKEYPKRMFSFLFFSILALSMEVFDFPPLWGVDSHAAWHLCTVLLPMLLYQFVADDIDEILREEDEKRD